jgi:hypothetical protein
MMSKKSKKRRERGRILGKTEFEIITGQKSRKEIKGYDSMMKELRENAFNKLPEIVHGFVNDLSWLLLSPPTNCDAKILKKVRRAAGQELTRWRMIAYRPTIDGKNVNEYEENLTPQEFEKEQHERYQKAVKLRGGKAKYREYLLNAWKGKFLDGNKKRQTAIRKKLKDAGLITDDGAITEIGDSVIYYLNLIKRQESSK